MNLDHDDEGLDELPAPPRKEIPAADRELLELAARALGARFEEVDGEGYGNLHFEDGSVEYAWNPLLFGNDAFSLQNQLKMIIEQMVGEVECIAYCGEYVETVYEPLTDDVDASVSRAITRAAAEIGKNNTVGNS